TYRSEISDDSATIGKELYHNEVNIERGARASPAVKMRLLIAPLVVGHPIRKGEMSVSFVFMDLLRSFTRFERPPDASAPSPAPPATAPGSALEFDGSKFSAPLFTLVLSDKLSIADVRTAVSREVARLAAEGGVEVVKLVDVAALSDAQRVRLRERRWG